jgi:UDP-N-acetyl-D-glucosamine dehydrogenase
MTLFEKLQDRSATVGIVGLSLAREFASARYRVLGVDIDRDRIERLRNGDSYVLDVPSEELRSWIDSGRLAVSADCSCVREMDAISICVPTPLRAKSKDPDLSFVLDAVHAIREHLRPQQLVILESTTFPGTTTEVIQPMLEASGLRAGRDFFLAFSPERVDPGNRVYRTRNIPKVVGGVTPECARHAEALYRNCLDRVVAVSSPDVAEMVKLLENTFRTVNIGLVNEFALLCSKLSIDVWEVIDAASTKPFGFMPFYPGPGLGGHCIPVDPHYLSWKAKVNGFHPKLIDAAVQVNQEMPRHIVRKVRDVLKGLKKSLRGSKILIVGVAYKRNTDDVRESPALEIIELLKQEGAEIRFSDPYVPVLRENGTRLSSTPLDEAELTGADCVLVVTDHSSVDYALVARHAAVVVDTRNALKDVPGENIHRL